MAKRKKRFKREKRAPNFKNDFLRKGFNQKKLFQNVMTKYGLKGYTMGTMICDGIYADFLFKDKKIAVMVDNLTITNYEINTVESLGYFLLLVSSQDQDEWLAAMAVMLGEDESKIRPKYSWILPGQFENNGDEPAAATQMGPFYYRNGEWVPKNTPEPLAPKNKTPMLVNGKRIWGKPA